jgi:hypothetical protein
MSEDEPDTGSPSASSAKPEADGGGEGKEEQEGKEDQQDKVPEEAGKRLSELQKRLDEPLTPEDKDMVSGPTSIEKTQQLSGYD